MAHSRRSYKGAAVANALSSSVLSAGATSITLASAMSGWTTDSNPFFVVIDPGTSKEEKVCVKYNTSTNLIVVDPALTSGWTASANGRGVDGTTDRQHDAGAVIYPVFTSIEADQANELVSKYTTNGDIVVHGSSTVKTISTGGAGNNNKVLTADSTVTDGGVKWAQVATGGIADDAVTADKIATNAVGSDQIAAGAVSASELNSNVAGAGLVGGAGDALAVNVDDSTLEISTDTVRVKDGGITSAKILDGTIVNGDINASAAIAYSKLALSNSIVAGDLTSASVTNAKLNNGASGDVPKVTVDTGDPTGGKNGDIWVKVV